MVQYAVKMQTSDAGYWTTFFRKNLKIKSRKTSKSHQLPVRDIFLVDELSHRVVRHVIIIRYLKNINIYNLLALYSIEGFDILIRHRTPMK